MKKKFDETLHVNNYLGCFGNFSIKDPICKHHCAIALRCVIERDHNVRLELLDDLVSSEGLYLKIQ